MLSLSSLSTSLLKKEFVHISGTLVFVFVAQGCFLTSFLALVANGVIFLGAIGL